MTGKKFNSRPLLHLVGPFLDFTECSCACHVLRSLYLAELRQEKCDNLGHLSIRHRELGPHGLI